MNEQEFADQLLMGSQPTGTDIGSKRGMIDLLHEKFNADDLVIIKNFTKRMTGWVYSDRKSLKIEHPSEYTMRVWQGEQKTRVLKPGAEVKVPGWEAYVGLVRFFKQYIQEEYPEEVSIRMNSPFAQEEFFNKAFGGIYDPNAESEPEEDIKAEVEKDLGLKDAKKAK